MAYSTQRVTSDGTLKVLGISIEFFDKVDILVFVNEVPQVVNVDYTWLTGTSIEFTNVVPAGQEVLLRRETAKAEPRHIFSQGSPFIYETLDEDFRQALYIAQEALEGSNVGDIYTNLDMHGNRIRNVGPAVDAGDAVSLGQVQEWSGSALNSAAQSAATAAASEAAAVRSEDWADLSKQYAEDAQNLPRTVRVGPNDPHLNPLPDISTRANMLLGFDTAGMPTALLPPTGSAADVLLTLQQATGSSRIGHSSVVYDTVKKALDAVLGGDAAIPFVRSDIPLAVRTVNEMLGTLSYSVWDFSYAITSKPTPNDPNTWDWGQAIQEASTILSGPDVLYPTKKAFTLLFPAGYDYHVSKADVTRNMNIAMDGGVLKPFDRTTPQAWMLRFIGYNRVYNMKVDGEYSVNYDTIVFGRGRYMDFVNCGLWRCMRAYTFGDPAWANNPALGASGDSEINVIGGEVNWGCQVVHTYGQNTIVTFSAGFRGYCFKQRFAEELGTSHPDYAAWSAVPDHVSVACGSMVYFTGCFIGNYTTTAMLHAVLQPVAEAQYQNRHGGHNICATHIEGGTLLDVAESTYPVQDSRSLLVSLTGGSGGYMQGTTGWWISAGPSQQEIYVSGCKFYGTAYPRIAYAPEARTQIDEHSFSNIFGEFGQTVYSPYLVGRSNLWIAHATSSSQAITSTPQVLTFPPGGEQVTDLHNDTRALWWNPGTGLFTARVALRSVVVNVSLVSAGLNPGYRWDVILDVNGSQVDIVSTTGATARAQFTTRRIAQGSTLRVRVSGPDGQVLSGTTATYVRVIADT